MSFEVKDSGERHEYESGMVRDTQEGKPDYALIFDGPLVDRYAEHLTKGAKKYGRRNWQLANSEEEYERFRASAARHFRQWLRGDDDEDHFAATVFNMNAAEYVEERLAEAYLEELRAASSTTDGAWGIRSWFVHGPTTTGNFSEVKITNVRDCGCEECGCK